MKIVCLFFLGASLNCTFEADLCGYIQDPDDDFDWTWISGGTPSSTTGPGFDHTFGDSTGETEVLENLLLGPEINVSIVQNASCALCINKNSSQVAKKDA